jgi:hypothetical protein
MNRTPVELQMLQAAIESQNQHLKQFLIRLLTDVLFYGEAKLYIFEDLKGVSTFKSRSVLRSYPCTPQVCINALDVFFPQILTIETKYPPKWLRWCVQPHHVVKMRLESIEKHMAAIGFAQLTTALPQPRPNA